MADPVETNRTEYDKMTPDATRDYAMRNYGGPSFNIEDVYTAADEWRFQQESTAYGAHPQRLVVEWGSGPRLITMFATAPVTMDAPPQPQPILSKKQDM